MPSGLTASETVPATAHAYANGNTRAAIISAIVRRWIVARAISWIAIRVVIGRSAVVAKSKSPRPVAITAVTVAPAESAPISAVAPAESSAKASPAEASRPNASTEASSTAEAASATATEGASAAPTTSAAPSMTAASLGGSGGSQAEEQNDYHDFLHTKPSA